jgi:hypothetical protein
LAIELTHKYEVFGFDINEYSFNDLNSRRAMNNVADINCLTKAKLFKAEKSKFISKEYSKTTAPIK